MIDTGKFKRLVKNLTLVDLAKLLTKMPEYTTIPITIEGNKIVVNHPRVRGEIVFEDEELFNIIRKLLIGG